MAEGSVIEDDVLSAFRSPNQLREPTNCVNNLKDSLQACEKQHSVME